MTTPLSEVRTHDCLGLPRIVMSSTGSRAQTYGAMRKLARKSGETFASVRFIADAACLRPRTCERHLGWLVENNWLEHHGRHKRRTPTYKLPEDMLNHNDAHKFAMLPRWAAKLLPTWAERATFALINSRHTLNETIGGGDDEGGDNFGRLGYSLKTLAKDCGLSKPAIIEAKSQLVRRGLLKIDQGWLDQDELGRFRTMADTLVLNMDFPVPNVLIDRGKEMADCRSKDLADCDAHRDKEVAVEGLKSGGDLVKIWRTPGKEMADTRLKSGGCSYINSYDQSLNQSSTSILEATAAEPPTAQIQDGSRFEAEEDIEKFIKNCQRILPYTSRLRDAVFQAFKNGCSLHQLRHRAAWFGNNLIKWKSEHRPGALYEGFAQAFPETPHDKGWPYQ